MAETTLDTLILALARSMGHAVSGAATTAGTTTVLTDSATLYQPDKTWVNHYLRATSGSNIGVSRLITSSTQASTSVTVSPAFNYAIATAVEYQILPIEYDYFAQAVKDAVSAAGDDWVKMVDDSTSLTYTAGTNEYSLPSDLNLLHQLYVGDSALLYWAPVTAFDVLGIPGAYKLVIRSWPLQTQQVTPSLTTAMRLVYSSSVTMLDTPTATLGIGDGDERDAVSFIREMALHNLYEMLQSRNPTGEQARSNMSMAQAHYNKAQQIRQRRSTQPIRTTSRTRRYAEQI